MSSQCWSGSHPSIAGYERLTDEDGVEVRAGHLRFGPGSTRTGGGVVDTKGEHEPVVEPSGNRSRTSCCQRARTSPEVSGRIPKL